MLMTNKQPAELPEPCVGAFEDPPTLVASELPSVFVFLLLVILAVRNDEVDASLLEPFFQQVGVVGPVADHALGLLSRATFATRDRDFGKRALRKRNFSGRGAFEPNSQRKTSNVDQYHPLRTLATLGFTDFEAPFSPERGCRPGTSLPTSAALRRPARSAAFAMRRATHPALPTALAAANKSRERDTCPAKIFMPHRFATPIECPPGRPGWTPTVGLAYPCGAFGSGSKGPNNSHCASLNNSNRFLLMQEVHQTNRLTAKSTA